MSIKVASDTQKVPEKTLEERVSALEAGLAEQQEKTRLIMTTVPREALLEAQAARLMSENSAHKIQQSNPTPHSESALYLDTGGFDVPDVEPTPLPRLSEDATAIDGDPLSADNLNAMLEDSGGSEQERP